MKATPSTIQRRQAHHRSLEGLAALNGDIAANGLKMWRALCKLEKTVRDATTAQCNGAAYGSQPFRQEGQWDIFTRQVHYQVKEIFSGDVEGFFINGDARGCALKLDPDKTTIPEGMETDWGRYGILAAQID